MSPQTRESFCVSCWTWEFLGSHKGLGNLLGSHHRFESLLESHHRLEDFGGPCIGPHWLEIAQSFLSNSRRGLTSLSSEMGTFRDVASWVARAHLLLLLRFLFLEFRGFGEREIFVSFSTPQV